ncbi:MAG: tetratricopeptide repeat protein [SAR324 cluster bacterium]|nr:tetratricopeptide repeat protein [SAR324 cluster bacterium]
MTEEILPLEEAPVKPAMDDFFFHAADFVYRRRKTFINLGIAIVVIIVAVYLVIQGIKRAEVKRAEALYAIQQKMVASGGNGRTFLEAHGTELNDFIKENQGTPEEKIALFERSNLFYSTLKYAEAEADLNKIIVELKPEAGLFPVANLFLANILRDQNRAEEAIVLLKSALNKRPSDMILIEIAEAYYGLSKFDQAKQNINDLKSQFPQSPYLERAERLLSAM